MIENRGYLAFTRSVGQRNTFDDTRFNDAYEVGEFPSEQKIQRISRIEVFANATNDARAIVVGLKVTYIVEEGTEPMVVCHGIVEGVRSVGIIDLQPSEILVGASGRVKKLVDANRNGRISFIQFSVYNKDNGTTVTKGSFGSTQNVGNSWGSYGAIAAFVGTETNDLGLTSLGFAKAVQDVSGFL